MIGFKRQPGRLVAATLTVAAMALAGCADSGNAPPPPLPGQADTSGYDQIIAGSPVADAAAIPAGSWADKIKQRGKLIRGGTDSGPLFSHQGPGHRQGHRLRRRAGRDAGALHHRQVGRRRRRAGDHHGRHPRDADPERRPSTRCSPPTRSPPPRAKKVAFAGPVLPLRRRDHGQGRRHRHQERQRPQRQERWPPRPTRPRCSRCSSSRRRPPRCCSRTTRSASPRCSRAGPTPTCSTRHPDLRREHEPGGQGRGGAVHPGALRHRRCRSTTRPPSSSSTTGCTKIYADGSWAKLWQATVGTVVKGDPPATPKLGSVPGS